METAIFGIVAERFVPCVDNRSTELYPLVNFCDNVIRALRDLIAYEIVAPMMGIPEFKDFLVSANTTRPSKNLSCDKERQQRRNNHLVEGDIPPELIVFVTAESGTCEVVNVVFEEREYRPSTQHRRGS